METTYKIFTRKGDRTVKLEEIPSLVANKEIKPETRIYNNDTKTWIDFKDHKRLHTTLQTLPSQGSEAVGVYKVILDGVRNELSIYRLERLAKKGIVTEETQVYDKITGHWIALKELHRLHEVLFPNTIKPYQQGQNTRVDSEYLHECQNCHHLYSKRAEKCPKCGNTVSATCNICKAEIPKSSSSCSECGDPDPFDKLDTRQVKKTDHYVKSAAQIESHDSINQGIPNETHKGPKGMGGWLTFLVVQMMLIGPVWAGMQTLGAFSLSEEKYPYLTDSDHWAYYKAMTWFAFGISSLISFVGGCELLQFHKWSSVSRAKTILVITGPVAHLVYAYIIPYICLGKAESEPSRVIGQLILALIPPVIWISYLSRSKRVRNTYINHP